MKHVLAVLIVWFWVSGDTYNYAGELSSVPAKYINKAIEVEVGKLSEYQKYTHLTKEYFEVIKRLSANQD